ncbi:GNAT family N-acetyltransferase [Sporosarcina sp. ACRSM]|uniref:GNAT family N-acetyltransferase n=1 Tax=Sporosarcina sp. ACRSM TaxID=2918216 RepID=UPI001EF60DFC|nr:GNAT family N-acetyltransferase [Sporosarcina sp. ACRSM]MCG7334446.1 GNAT family N-acetyltransferase [Sporosarcina sp. ACRSM]
MNIFKATLNDLEALTGLFDLYRIFYQQKSDLSGAKKFIQERLLNEESVIYIACDESDPIGFVQLYPTFSSVSMRRTWVLNDLYVKESGRGKGIGENLIKTALAFAKETDAKGVLLETGADNTTAQRLYEKIGFVKETAHFYFYEI